MLFALFIAQVVNPVPEPNAGWVGAGLLGSVLAWLMFKHLPSKDEQVRLLIEMKDKQIAAILAENLLDRERERTDRHDRNNVFQKTLNEMAIAYGQQMRDIQTEHKIDAEKDRQSFLQRSADLGTIMKMAIEKQTLDLERAIKSSCLYQVNGGYKTKGDDE